MSNVPNTRNDQLTNFDKKLIDTAVDIASNQASASNNLAFIPRMFAKLPAPISKQTEDIWSRVNGKEELIMYNFNGPVPYGGNARLLIAFVTTESKCQKSREINIGYSKSAFVRRMGRTPTGGKNGSLTRLSGQLCNLANTEFEFIDTRVSIKPSCFKMLNAGSKLWERSRGGEWDGYITFSAGFYKNVVERALPIDDRVLELFTGCPLAFDLYCMLSLRIFSINAREKHTESISFEELSRQFSTPREKRSVFRCRFRRALTFVKVVYPQARAVFENDVLTLKKSPLHVKATRDDWRKSCG